MKKLWFDEAWQDYLLWQKLDEKTVDKINAIIRDVERGGYSGIGKPEPLEGEFSSFWSRRIDGKNRFVYRLKDGQMEILSCRGHYDDK